MHPRVINGQNNGQFFAVPNNIQNNQQFNNQMSQMQLPSQIGVNYHNGNRIPNNIYPIHNENGNNQSMQKPIVGNNNDNLNIQNRLPR